MMKIATYEVEEKPIGVGGMGRVLRGTDSQGAPVAIKEILPEFAADEEYRKRIDLEIEVMQKLPHPDAVNIFNHFTLDGKIYIVMELVDGMDIEKYVRTNGPIPADKAAEYMVQLLYCIQYIHDNNIVHRDIKPSNIMIRNKGGICVLDFGIAKDLNGRGPEGSKTQFGLVIGTDGYMSPEQANGYSIDHRTDVYSLGCVMFYMLTGHHAYPNQGSNAATQLSIVELPFPRLSKYLKKVDKKMQAILDHATEKNMMKRFQSCKDFAEKLAEEYGIERNDEQSSFYQRSDNAPAKAEVAPQPVTEAMPQIPSMSNGQPTNGIKLTIGREDCDICVSDPSHRVSRHHADIEYVENSGKPYFVYRDYSTNGTLIDDTVKLTNGMCFEIVDDARNHSILLAGDRSLPVNWNEVKRLIWYKTGKKPVGLDPSGSTAYTDDHPWFSELEDTGNMKLILGALSLLLPPVGFMLWSKYKDENYIRASHCSLWAWLGMAFYMIMASLCFIVYVLLFR